MFLFRAAIIVSAVIMLMPTDETSQANLSNTAVATSRNAQTFCERQPATCAAGAELWETFKKKSEYALALSVRLVADYMRGPGGDQRSRTQHAGHPASIQQPVPQPAVDAPVQRAEPPAAPATAPSRGTLTPQDTAPSWRRNLARNPA
jgi:hypothetical protein